MNDYILSRDKSNLLRSCTIIATDANEALKSIHNRMPLIIPPDEARLWLDNEITQTESPCC